MGTLKVIVPDEVEHAFRRAAMGRFGYAKGALSKAAVDAMGSWASQQEDWRAQAEAIGDPIDAIAGMLRHVKKSSVQLQHEAGALRGGRYARTRR